MPQQNVEALRRGYEVFNRRDIDAWLDLAGIPDAPVPRGHEALREWVAMMDGIWVDARYEPEEFIEAGEFVVVAVRAKGRGRASDIPMDVPMFQVFEFQGGTVRRLGVYLDRSEALKVVGLSE